MGFDSCGVDLQLKHSLFFEKQKYMLVHLSCQGFCLFSESTDSPPSLTQHQSHSQQTLLFKRHNFLHYQKPSFEKMTSLTCQLFTAYSAFCWWRLKTSLGSPRLESVEAHDEWLWVPCYQGCCCHCAFVVGVWWQGISTLFFYYYKDVEYCPQNAKDSKTSLFIYLIYSGVHLS